MTRANSDIRAAAKKFGINLWMVAAEIGVSEATLCRRMRFELRGDEKSQLMSAIEEIARREAENHADDADNS
ncbi:MAG: hypothetical protein KHZ05_11975 [Oscillospiraceae bacterium]|nr:hypothetical protein [Oscillospiraceae bacterium]